MASFSAVLSFASVFETDLTSFILDINQDTDILVRPASPTFGGIITLSFNTPTHPLVTEWMFEPAKQLSGTVTMLGLHKEIMKTLDFMNAYCIGLTQRFDGTANSSSLTTTITMSPEKIAVSYMKLDNQWPATEAY